MTATSNAITLLLLLSTLNPFVDGSPEPVEDTHRFQVERRVNAHGNEFMAIALTNDGKHLIVGTESGTLIVWGIPERRVVKELNQGSPVHCVVALKDSDTFVAAGGQHTGSNHRGVIRKWHFSSGKFEDLQGPSDSTFLTLAADPTTGLIAAGSASGALAVWNAQTGTLILNVKLEGLIAGFALVGREIFLTTVITEGLGNDSLSPNSILRLSVDKPNQEPTQFIKKEAKRMWTELKVSPDLRFIAARGEGEGNSAVVLLDAKTGKEIAKFEAKSVAWSASGSLILFDREVATTRVTVDAGGSISRSDLLKSGTWHAAGSPGNLTGHVVSPDGSMAWQVFQLGATLVESDLNKKSFEVLHRLSGYVYAMQVRERLGFIATGGDDEFVRVRKLSDLSVVSEFRVTPGVPQGVALMDDGRHVVFSASAKDTPSRISVGDLTSGEARILFELPEPFVQVTGAVTGFIYDRSDRLVLADATTGASVREFKVAPRLEQFAVSANGEWLVAANEQGKLFSFDIRTGKRIYVSKQSVDSLTRLRITNDGRYVYTTEFQASMKRWDTRLGTMKELASIRGQARALMLSSDERRIAVGGNHRDVEVFDVETGERLLSIQVAASDFYVTNVWLGGERLLFSTDAGVLFDGRLKR